jgi:hypothetical protein
MSSKRQRTTGEASSNYAGCNDTTLLAIFFLFDILLHPFAYP